MVIPVQDCCGWRTAVRTRHTCYGRRRCVLRDRRMSRSLSYTRRRYCGAKNCQRETRELQVKRTAIRIARTTLHDGLGRFDSGSMHRWMC